MNDDNVRSIMTDKTVGMDQLRAFDSRGVPGPGVTLEDALSEVRRLASPWIARAQGMPEQRELVLVALLDGRAYSVMKPEGSLWKDVTHWMRIPPLPEKNSD